MSDETNCYGARFPGKPGYGAVCVIDEKYAKDTAKSVAGWIRKGATIERCTVQQAREGMLEYLDARDGKATAQGALGLYEAPVKA